MPGHKLAMSTLFLHTVPELAYTPGAALYYSDRETSHLGDISASFAHSVKYACKLWSWMTSSV